MWKLLKLLREGREVALALAGGVDYNARILYAAREMLRRQGCRRELDLKFASLLVGVSGGLASETGVLSEQARRFLLESPGVGRLSREGAVWAIQEFEEEFVRQTPYRLRLWRVLVRRLLRYGISLVVIPVAHSRDSPPGIRWGKPVALGAVPERIGKADADRVQVFHCEGGRVVSQPQSLEAWAVFFVRDNLFY